MSDSNSNKPTPAWEPRGFRSSIDPGWIDYNGHLRDGYYALIASAAIDALMDDLGIDARYRHEQNCTLYTVEMHVRFVSEIKLDDALVLDRYPVEFDAKRLRILIAIRTARSGVAAVVDFMLMHVQQDGSPHSTPFPALVRDRLAAWRQQPVPAELLVLGSRPMTLNRQL